MRPTDGLPSSPESGVALPRWNQVLRALREARGVTQDGWSAHIGVSFKTVQRWEAGERVPDAGAEAAIVAYCRERDLFRTFQRGPLAGLVLTPDVLRDLLAEARWQGARGSRRSAVGHNGTQDATRVAPETLPVPPPSNLPAPLTSFVGRERELAAARRTLAGTRLLTLTGAGGSGKSRLALALAEELVPAYPHGVWFVELAALADSALLPETVAAALGIEGVLQRPLHDVLAAHLAPSHLLLVLDNCEHLLGACAVLVETLLRACPHLEVLTTSREPLGVGGETLFAVPPLELAASATTQSDAVVLFAERARQYRPDFALTADNGATVARICARLDGMPLAIELAAACVKVLSPEQIWARLSDRFRLLTGGSRTALPRQQTLRATMDWSYDLLADAERTLLLRLSVFAGGFALEAAEAVGSAEWGLRTAESSAPAVPTLHSDVLGILTRLVDTSLVVAEERDGAVRYRMLETVRQYAAEKLATTGKADALQEQHALWCLALAEAAWPYRSGSEQQAWLERLTVEQDNLRAALGWYLASEHGRSPGVQLGALLWWWWHVRGHRDEGRRWLTALLAREGDAPPDTRARALEGAAWFAADQGDYDEAARLGEDCLALWRELGEQLEIAGALNSLGVVLAMGGDHARAQELHQESLELARELGDPKRIAAALNNLGIAARQRGEPDRAVALYEESLPLVQALGDTVHIVMTLLNLGHAYRDKGALDQAMVWYRESLTLSRDLQNRQAAARCLRGMAAIAGARGDAVRAARLCGAAAALREAIGVQVPAAGRAGFEEITTDARAALGEAAFAAAWAAGQALSLEAAVADALADALPG